MWLSAQRTAAQLHAYTAVWHAMLHTWAETVVIPHYTPCHVVLGTLHGIMQVILFGVLHMT